MGEFMFMEKENPACVRDEMHIPQEIPRHALFKSAPPVFQQRQVEQKAMDLPFFIVKAVRL